MSNQIDYRDATSAPTVGARNATLNRPAHQRSETAVKGDSSVGRLSPTGRPAVNDRVAPAAHSVERQSDHDAVTRAENEGMVLTTAAVALKDKPR
jgi:hypothetical protein